MSLVDLRYKNIIVGTVSNNLLNYRFSISSMVSFLYITCMSMSHVAGRVVLLHCIRHYLSTVINLFSYDCQFSAVSILQFVIIHTLIFGSVSNNLLDYDCQFIISPNAVNC